LVAEIFENVTMTLNFSVW